MEYRHSLMCVFTFVLNLCSVDPSPHVKQRNILVFGGNGFIGAETVSRLLEQDREHSVTVVSRGNWYWDSAWRIKPFVQHVKCDRMQTLRKCEAFLKLMEYTSDLYFDAVLDFSGYHPFVISDAAYILEGRVGLYVYISTDSVYEVCDAAPVRDSGLLESDAVRPTSAQEQERLNGREEYGHRKLQCEEELIKAHHHYGLNYVILRLPDVIGPRDTTYRWWIYQLWIRLHKHLFLSISVPSKLLLQPLSLVYVQDVADIIVKLISRENNTFVNQVYNLAFEETPTLKQVLELTKAKLNITDLLIEPNEADDAIYLYPSISRGPIAIDKANRQLNWLPTRLDFAIDKTVQFYEEAIKSPQFGREKYDIVRMLQHSLSNEPKGHDVAMAIFQEYSIDIGVPRDEL